MSYLAVQLLVHVYICSRFENTLICHTQIIYNRPVDYLGVKRSEREARHSPPSSAEIKNSGAIPPLPHMSAWYSA
jgi:hypothetical protein